MNSRAESYIETIIPFGIILLNIIFGNRFIVSQISKQVNGGFYENRKEHIDCIYSEPVIFRF